MQKSKFLEEGTNNKGGEKPIHINQHLNQRSSAAI